MIIKTINTMKVNNYLMAVTLGCGCALWLTTGCTQRAETKQPEPVTVSIFKTTHADAWHALRYVGVVEAETGINLSFKVGGYVERVAVQPGMQVAKGTLLATLSSETLEQSYQASQAKLAQAEDAMRRMQELYEKESLPEIKYVEVKTQLEQAQAAYKVAAQNREDAKLYAPQAGYIGMKGIEAGENVLPGQSILSLLQLDQVKVKVAVPEREIARLTLQSDAVVEVAALGDAFFQGKLTEKGVVADRMTHTYEVKFTLPNKEKQLLPGMVCQVTLPLSVASESATLVLPNRAIQVANDNRTYVWCVEQGQAKVRFVTIGELTPQGVVITSGLTEGVEVIVEGMQKVSEGANVRVL
ncbi:MAG: efflux RND transporter periplasmic adaptor subunit [Phocaeicola sp.]